MRLALTLSATWVALETQRSLEITLAGWRQRKEQAAEKKELVMSSFGLSFPLAQRWTRGPRDPVSPLSIT